MSVLDSIRSSASGKTVNDVDHGSVQQAGFLRRSQIAFATSVACLAGLGLAIESNYLLHILILALIWCVVVASWDLLMGYAGLMNFGQLVFFAVGGYASQMLALQAGLGALPSLFVAVAASASFGLLVGLPCLRLRGEYVALFTFAVHLAFPTLLQLGRNHGTGGSAGLMGGQPLELFGYSLTSADKTAWFFLMLAIASFCVWLIYFVLLRGRMGLAFIALRDAEQAARVLGVNEVRYRLLSFVISAGLTGLAGALYANYLGVIAPTVLGNEFFLIAMTMLCVGGMGRFPGVILGAFVITIGNELLREFGEYRLLILGVIVVASTIWLPHGIAAWLKIPRLPFRTRL
ncbi:branched-chain amino acid ABC transporter permease [Aquibium sp. A9E412]|uniref:branched-chain amino acid ABC transporter permease n=1 Tax=Aquibium sp. A9E412 TaxID=2976767 RepID=UPI0025B118B8|nr:branched-chain amino acid ABC transporter permease [Aquibium sp. A9E412]MDN2565757.1 branched-chain amino acid ABC transporter permease [Aquibium sp. A9E412]